MQSKVKLTFQKHFENKRKKEGWGGGGGGGPLSPSLKSAYKSIIFEPREFPVSNILLFSVRPKVSSSGKRKVIAVGSLDMSEYIKEEPASHDITVTLRPVKKSVLPGSLQLILSSIMLEDGIPR